MALSPQRRVAEQELVLRTLASELGDEMLGHKWWDIDRQDLAQVLLTTWVELEELGLVRRHLRSNLPLAYELTEAGWVKGLQLAGILDSDAFRARCLELVR